MIDVAPNDLGRALRSDCRIGRGGDSCSGGVEAVGWKHLAPRSEREESRSGRCPRGRLVFDEMLKRSSDRGGALKRMTDFRGRSSYSRVIETILWVIEVAGRCIMGRGLNEVTERDRSRWNKSSSDLPFRSRTFRKLGFGGKSVESAHTLKAS